nr:hypothetical protein 2 [bacterium]
MVLVYVEDKDMDSVAQQVETIKESHPVSYRNPRLFYRHPYAEPCDHVIINGDWPEIQKAYKGKVITDVNTVEAKPEPSELKSTNYNISELQDMRSDFTDEEWETFTQGDKRKTVPE